MDLPVARVKRVFLKRVFVAVIIILLRVGAVKLRIPTAMSLDEMIFFDEQGPIHVRFAVPHLDVSF